MPETVVVQTVSTTAGSSICFVWKVSKEDIPPRRDSSALQ